jgi:diguanylate cyclase (GGDEF)-like protein
LRTSHPAAGSDTDRLTLTSIALRQVGRLDALQRVMMLIVHAPELEPALPGIARAIFEQFGLQSVGIGIINDGWIEYPGARWALAAEARPAQWTPTDHAPVPADFDLRRPFTSSWQADTGMPPGAAVEYDTTELGHAARLPIHVHGRPFGILSIKARDDARIDGELVEIFGQIAEALSASFEREEQARGVAPAHARSIPPGGLLDVIAHIAELPRIDNAIQLVLADVAELLDLASVSLLLSNPVSPELFTSSPAIGASMDEEYQRLASAPLVRRAMNTLQSRSGALATDGQAAGNGALALAVPLIARGEAAGALVIEPADRNAFSDAEHNIAGVIARHLSFAVQREQRMRSFSRQNLLLSLVERVTAFIARSTAEDDLLASMAREVRRTFGYDCSIAMLVENRLEFLAIELCTPHEMPNWIDDGIPLGIGVMGRVARSGQPVFIRDVTSDPHFLDTGSNTLSEICVPVRVNGEVAGVINIESDASNPLDDVDYEIILILANHIGIALSNRRLIAAEREARQAIEAIQRVSTIVAETLDPDEALRRIADTLAELLGYPVISLAFIEGATIVRKASYGYDPDMMPEVISVNDGVSGRVIRSGQPTFIENVRADPDYIGARMDLVSEICVPIRCNGEIVGLLNVEGTRERPLTNWDLDLLTTFAEHAGVLLNNARAYAELSREATLDPMTGVPNLRFFQQRLQAELDGATREGQPVSLVVIDLDDLKEVNDTHGHLTGDQVLRELARRMSALLRGQDLLARYAGDEFVALLPGVDEQHASEIAARLLDAARREPVALPDTPPIPLSVSIGVATFPDDATDSTALLHAADMAMYVAKEGGKNNASTARQAALLRERAFP